MPCKRKYNEGGGSTLVCSPSKRSKKTSTGDSKVISTNSLSKSLLRHPVLSLYYPRVLCLRDYLLSKLPESSQNRRRALKRNWAKRDDQCDAVGVALQATLDHTLVGTFNETRPEVEAYRQKDFQVFTQSQERSLVTQNERLHYQLQAELVDYTTWALFNRTNSIFSRPSHILCHGFIRAGNQGDQRPSGAFPITIPGIAVQYPNANVERLKSSPWPEIRKLLGDSGDAIIRNLLLDCGIFIGGAGEDDELQQISGIPLCDLSVIEMREGCPISPAPTHAPIAKSKKSIVEADLKGLNQIILVRNRILYARPALNAQGNVRFGLRHVHVFNRYPATGNVEQTTHVMKYVFPRQFGLHNVFSSSRDPKQTVQAFNDYTVREHEIRRVEQQMGAKPPNSTWMPRRLRGLPFHLIEKIRKRHARCSYTGLLRHYCSLEAVNATRIRVKSVTSSPQPTAFITQRPISSIAGSTEPEISVPPAQERDKPSQVSIPEYATPSASVSAFCQSVMHKLLPPDTLGVGPDGDANRNHLYKEIDRFVQMRRFESLSLHHILQHIKISSIPWLRPPTVNANSPMARSDLQKRAEILSEFLYYIFDSILIPLIRSHFYVTESNIHRNQLFYFRHDLWQKLSEPSIRTLKATNFQELSSTSVKTILSCRSLGFSNLRLLPKRTGMRPITNLRRRTLKTHDGKAMLGTSINASLGPVFSMLNYEKAAQNQKLGGGLFSVGQIHGKIRDFQQGISGRKLYFVKVDVQSCFDSIPQEQLLKYVRGLISNYQYSIKKVAHIKAADSRWSGNSSKPYRKFIATAMPASRSLSSKEFEIPGDPGRSRSVVVDTGNQKMHDARRLVKLLDDHVNNNLVKIGKQYYRQKRGIPQGSVLSTLLCNFFYGSFENTKLEFLRQDSLLLRMIDDFLLITTNQSHARRFLQIMADGDKEFGIISNPAKSLVNFDIMVNGSRVPQLHDTQVFPYCGMLINTESLELSKDRHRDDPYVRHSLSIELNRSPGKTFQRRVFAAFKIQMHAMVVDTKLNSISNVMINLYEIYLETAMKMHSYIKALGYGHLPNQQLIIRTCLDLLGLAVNLTRGKRKTKVIDHYECTVTRRQHMWLMALAFKHVLHKKQARYSILLTWLNRLEEETCSSLAPDIRAKVQFASSRNTIFAEYRY